MKAEYRKIQFWFLAFGASVAISSAEGRPVDVRAFGARGDGVTDDAVALQAALDECPQGSTVILPQGRWLVRLDALRLRSGVHLRGEGKESVIIKGRDLETALEAVNASSISVSGIRFAVEPTTRAETKGLLAHFRHCRDVRVYDCTFDGTATNGLPSQFSLCQFECCNAVKCLDNRFLNAAGSATGVTGARWEPQWGRGSEFARNVIEDYCDTGIGLWTGAREAHVHGNRLRGRAEKYTSFPVGIDVDGGRQSLIEQNDIAGGHIAIRLWDCHSGDYPVEAMVVRENVLHDQLSYDETHPAWAVKPQNTSPNSRLEIRFERNRIVQTDKHACAFMGGDIGQTVLYLEQNECVGATFWQFGSYAEGVLELFSGGQKVDWRTGIGNNAVRER